MRKQLKRVVVLLLVAATMAAMGVMAGAADDWYFDAVGGATVKYSAECEDTIGAAETWITNSGGTSDNWLTVEASWYVMNTSTGSVSLYDTQYAEDKGYCSVDMYLGVAGYTGQRVESKHTAWTYRIDTDTESSDTHEFTIYK